MEWIGTGFQPLNPSSADIPLLFAKYMYSKTGILIPMIKAIVWGGIKVWKNIQQHWLVTFWLSNQASFNSGVVFICWDLTAYVTKSIMLKGYNQDMIEVAIIEPLR